MSWNESRDTLESLAILKELSLVCKQQGGPLSALLYELVEREDYSALVNYSIDYEQDYTVDDFIYGRQILGFYQKLDFLALGIDRQQVAYAKFVEAEEKCRLTNARFRIGSRPFGTAVESILFMAQRKIANILGIVPSLDSFNFSFGPGATTNVNSRRASPRVKLGADLACSSKLAPVVGHLLAEVPSWMALHDKGVSDETYLVDVTISPGKLVFVPKNAKTDRSIIVEPTLNSFFQKGVGAYIRDRLLHSGIDLTDQSRNQELAFNGSVSGELATVDLSMASDTLATNLVRSLLSPDWFSLLDHLRTTEVMYKGSTFHLDKFSSMGNGFTFELETLIFFAISHSVCVHCGVSTEDVSVYGDDIIIPVAAYDSLVSVLEICGFSANLEKSFSRGPFRESCGQDYLQGFSIRPAYVKTHISDRTLYSLHNWFIRNGERELAAACESFTYPQYRLYGPDGYGDGHLIGTHRLRRNRRLHRDQWAGGYFDTYSLKSARNMRTSAGDAVLPTYSVYVRSGEQSPTDPFIVRGSVGYRKIAIYTLATRIFG